MKRMLNLIMKNVVFGLLVAAIWGLPACKPDDPTELVVKVVNNDDEEVVGATVRVYCTELECIIEDIKTTDEKGFSIHTFENEAVLAIEVTKMIGTDTLSGNGTADLVKNESISVKIKIN